ncbi:hypothetical protein KJ693_03095 [bacterium]|nr:hypothetical protein [bacterium]MBU1614277.1 hypothetical protein [bacterium]
MDNNEKIIFEKVLDLMEVPETDSSIKQKIMKIVFFLMVVREIVVFNCSIPGILVDEKI